MNKKDEFSFLLSVCMLPSCFKNLLQYYSIGVKGIVQEVTVMMEYLQRNGKKWDLCVLK
jgi:hypothetical protein